MRGRNLKGNNKTWMSEMERNFPRPSSWNLSELTEHASDLASSSFFLLLLSLIETRGMDDSRLETLLNGRHSTYLVGIIFLVAGKRNGRRYGQGEPCDT